MANISNDQQLRSFVDALSIPRQRLLAARFASSVAQASDNRRLQHALAVALDPDSGEPEREEAYKAAKSIAVKTYTACGRDADGDCQAEHFLAAAIAAALTPDALLSERANLAWKAAIQARMSKNCMMIDNDSGELESEATRQYQTASVFPN